MKQLFDKRYLLIEKLGEGASAEVWMAEDTLAGNLRVAVKILRARHDMDTYGMHNLQREFSFVYNLQHQNLLTPTNYAIADGTPYLVLPFCENGSTESMVGRADENDIIQVMHDVAAALEQLHGHGIVHQDIKPANILVDDNCNYMVSDFGISTDAVHSSGRTASGTRAYMGPERFESDATPINMNDIYALGCTVYELITGDVPFGENGGLAQQVGEEMPSLPDTLSLELRQLIGRCLNPEPWNRPSAKEIRELTERRIQTGEWKEKNVRRLYYIVAGTAATVLLLAGLLVWDYYRTKVYYYKDYVEYYGIPKGIGRLTHSEMRHRDQSYRMEYSRRLLRRLSLVNPEGYLRPHGDNESVLTRFTDVRYYYTDEGKIDYKAIYDQSGRLLFKMDYDDALKTVTFRHGDEWGTEMNLQASTTDPEAMKEQYAKPKSRISRYLLTFDGNGLLTRLRYVGLQNVPACDADRIYGVDYDYDSQGHKVREQYLGLDGKPTSNADGLSIKEFTYDDEDNWTGVRYLNTEGGPSHEGNNVQWLKLQNDKWGNRIGETYHTLDGQPALRSDIGAAGILYDIDEQGHIVKLTLIGIEGKPMPGKEGFVSEHRQYDERGFLNLEYYTDADNVPAPRHDNDGDTYGRVELANNEYGQPLRVSVFDESGSPAVVMSGYHTQAFTYDSLGRQISVTYYDTDGKPARFKGTYTKVSLAYDEQSNITQLTFTDEKGQPTADESGVSIVRAEYNRQGGLVRMAYRDGKDKPVMNNEFVSAVTIEYDDLGNRKSMTWTDTNGKLTNGISGAARRVYTYDTKTNALIASTDYDASGKLLEQNQWLYDQRGNIVRKSVLVASGQVKKGTAIEHNKYDENNRVTSRWWTDQNDHPCNEPGTKVARQEYKYDLLGNMVECTFYGSTGKPSTDMAGAFKREFRYNEAGQRIYQRDLGPDGKPLSGKNQNPEAKMEYDRMGNVCLLECYDGYGKPRLSADGFFRMTAEYNTQNKEIQRCYYDLNGKLTKSKEQDFARRTTAYNSRGGETEQQYYGADGKLYRTDSYMYNEYGRPIEMVIKDASGKQDDRFWGFSRLVITYEKNGMTPHERTYYNAAGRKLGYCRYDTRKHEWGALTGAKIGQFNAIGNQWKDQLLALARQCPTNVGNGITLLSIDVENERVTCRLKSSGITLNEMDDASIETMRSGLRANTAAIKKSIGVPDAVQFVLIAYDSEGQRII